MTVYRGKAAVAFLSGEIDTGEANVVCPNCGSEFTHIHHVGTLVGSDEGESVSAYEGTVATGRTPSRRAALEIVFSCENCPEHFALVIQQHKGNNLVEVHQNVISPTE